MSWLNQLPGFYDLTSAWLFLLFVPLIIFYFLKLKRPRMEIPSLALWRQVINDQRVNSPFQKFKRNLLLLLQLLLLLFLVLAAMQPFWPSGAERAKYLPVLIDASASMAALDRQGGESRLDAAKVKVRELIDNILPDQRLCLIAVDSSPRRLTEFTNNKRVLRESLDRLQVSQVPSQLDDALRMTQALSRTVPIETVLLFTDGNLPAMVDFELPFTLNYQKLPGGGPNIGITAVNSRRAASHWDIFVRLEATNIPNMPPPSGTVQLLQDGKVVGEESASPEAGKSERLVFRVESDQATTLEIRLRPQSFDSLDADNVAYLDLPLVRELTVFCSPELALFRHALEGHKGIVLYPDESTERTASSYDLLVTDRQTDLTREAAVVFTTGMIPEELKNLISVQVEISEVLDWQRAAPLLQHVQLGDVQITEKPTAAKDVRDKDFEELGYEILMHGQAGPLVLKKETPGGKLAFHLLFHTDRSTLPYRVGFPILVSNLLDIALQQAGLAEVRGQSTGILPPKTLQPDRTYRVTAPDGTTADAKSTAEGVVSGVAAPRTGQYQFAEGGRPVAKIGVSLLSSSESSLVGVEQLQFRELNVGAATATLKSDKPLWRILAWIALAFLLFEWWYFQRPPSVMVK